MKKVIISPYSRLLRTGKPNPKNYPWWTQVVNKLQNLGIYVIQIGDSKQNESSIGANETIIDMPLRDLQEKIKDVDSWISVDNFFPHLCSFTEKRGVVIWGISDPLIFGYQQNINLLKNRKYLREKQFDIWENATYYEHVFMDADTIVNAVMSLMD
jgi:hypothetical protein